MRLLFGEKLGHRQGSRNHCYRRAASAHLAGGAASRIYYCFVSPCSEREGVLGRTDLEDITMFWLGRVRRRKGIKEDRLRYAGHVRKLTTTGKVYILVYQRNNNFNYMSSQKAIPIIRARAVYYFPAPWVIYKRTVQLHVLSTLTCRLKTRQEGLGNVLDIE